MRHQREQRLKLAGQASPRHTWQAQPGWHARGGSGGKSSGRARGRCVGEGGHGVGGGSGLVGVFGPLGVPAHHTEQADAPRVHLHPAQGTVERRCSADRRLPATHGGALGRVRGGSRARANPALAAAGLALSPAGHNLPPINWDPVPPPSPPNG
eukprot:scaffold3385_cov119-Isochrysis_galbana.AAC.5